MKLRFIAIGILLAGAMVIYWSSQVTTPHQSNPWLRFQDLSNLSLSQNSRAKYTGVLIGEAKQYPIEIERVQANSSWKVLVKSTPEALNYLFQGLMGFPYPLIAIYSQGNAICFHGSKVECKGGMFSPPIYFLLRSVEVPNISRLDWSKVNLSVVKDRVGNRDCLLFRFATDDPLSAAKVWLGGIGGGLDFGWIAYGFRITTDAPKLVHEICLDEKQGVPLRTSLELSFFSNLTGNYETIIRTELKYIEVSSDAVPQDVLPPTVFTFNYARCPAYGNAVAAEFTPHISLDNAKTNISVYYWDSPTQRVEIKSKSSPMDLQAGRQESVRIVIPQGGARLLEVCIEGQCKQLACQNFGL